MPNQNSKILYVLFIGLLLAFCAKGNVMHTKGEDNGPHYHSVPLILKAAKRLEYRIKPNILLLLELSNRAPEQANSELVNYRQNTSPFNVAEQYLLLLIQGKVKQHSQQHQQVIELLEQAKYLSENIVKRQLQTPIFADLYQVLAQSLVAINDFENAYHAKKTYIEKLDDYSDDKRHETIALITEKHEIAHKIKANELLDNESKLKVLQLDEMKKQQVNQQLNFILILCGIVVFFLLLLRQFKVRKKLLLLSEIDSLTGLYNRAALFIRGQALVKLSIEQGKELSVLLIDVDHFKQVNDDYGHCVGDLVLIEIANLVNETMRARDLFARLGGEEFVALLPSTDIDKAKAIAVRVLEKISQHNFENLGVTRAITLSIGVANIKSTTAFDELLHAADLAMYQAKKRGRNQMVNYAMIAQDKERRIHPI